MERINAQPIRYLFLDTTFVENIKNVSFHVNPPERHEAVIFPDKPWEKRMISFYLSVIEEEGKLRMWYICRDSLNSPNIAYAESTDGVNWVKPILNIVEYQGSTDNNLVNLKSKEGMVYKDPNAKTADEKYIYISSYQGSGSYRFTSPDGLRWRRDSTMLFPFRSDSQHIVFWDKSINKYVLYLRGWYPRPDNFNVSDKTRRTVVRYTTDDLTKPFNEGCTTIEDIKKLPYIVDKMPVVLTTDAFDPPQTDVYNISALQYPLDCRWYIGFPSFFSHGKSLFDGRLEVQFTGSMDGISWQRYDRSPYISPGLEGSGFENIVFMGVGLVVRGDEIWQYGTGFHSRHGDKEARKKKTDGIIYRYIQRLDGFVSLDFGNIEGSCVTTPMRVEGSCLILNINTGALGNLKVGLLDSKGNGIVGFNENECDIIQVNSTNYKVSWKGIKDLSEFTGEEVRLKLSGSRTKLFCFYFQ